VGKLLLKRTILHKRGKSLNQERLTNKKKKRKKGVGRPRLSVLRRMGSARFPAEKEKREDQCLEAKIVPLHLERKRIGLVFRVGGKKKKAVFNSTDRREEHCYQKKRTRQQA